MKKVLLVVLVMVLSACQKTPETESFFHVASRVFCIRDFDIKEYKFNIFSRKLGQNLIIFAPRKFVVKFEYGKIIL